MKKFPFLLLDANVVIELHRLPLWEKVVEACGVHLAAIVAEEAKYYEDDAGEQQPIDLQPFFESGKITRFEHAPSELNRFRSRFLPEYVERLDPGETESLIHLMTARDANFQICSADAIVFRVLAALHLGERGISLEELLASLGMGHKLPRQFTKAFREESSKRGFRNGLWGRATKP